jgi:hypothetical protein
VFTARELNDVFEEDFADPDTMAGSGGVPDPLLAELGRARTGQMRDIVASKIELKRFAPHAAEAE